MRCEIIDFFFFWLFHSFNFLFIFNFYLPFLTIRRLSKLLFILNKFEFALEIVCAFVCGSVQCQRKIILSFLYFSIFAILPFKFDRILNNCFWARLPVLFRWLHVRSPYSVFNIQHECSTFDLFHTFEQSQSKMNGLPSIIQFDVI